MTTPEQKAAELINDLLKAYDYHNQHPESYGALDDYEIHIDRVRDALVIGHKAEQLLRDEYDRWLTHFMKRYSDVGNIRNNKVAWGAIHVNLTKVEAVIGVDEERRVL